MLNGRVCWGRCDDGSDEYKKKLMWIQSIAKEEGWPVPKRFRPVKVINEEYIEDDKGDDTDTEKSDDDDAEEEKVEAEEVRDAGAIHDVTYICSFMLVLCSISTYNTYDIMRRVWAKTIAHAQKLQKYNDEDDLKINMPRATLVDMDIDDPSDVIGDTSIYDEAVYKVKSDLEVYKRRTVDDPAVKITRATESIEGDPTTVIASSYSTVESIKKTHHASLEITGRKNEDSAAPDRMMLRQTGTCERDLWTTTSIMVANLHQQLS